MNKSKLKSYAPAARREFIQAVTDRAHFYGLSENKTETQAVEEKGDVAIIGGRAFPRKIAAQRKNLEQRIEHEGFAQVMEAVAYTWFNRLLALRYMEIHGYLEHGFRVLSNPGGITIPEILEQAAHIQLPGLDQKKAVELKLDGSRDVELYRMILVAQCNVLNTAMPFLFERIDDETELLLPDNLLHSDSLIRKLVTEIDEEDWQQVEIIGWLYQFYISEKKDQVIGKVVKPEDIPAATQLFTPNWIVKYMVQNSLGRMWLATYPNSSLKGKMEYYIEPAEQTEEVKAQLAAITPKELNPETITLLDPASGSGHILVEAYDLFKEIYLERGYRSRDIPRLILEKNLYGLDIDDRAAQMAGFALLMKARGDDRKILKENSPRLNVMAIQSSEGIDAESLADALLKMKTSPSPQSSPSRGEDDLKSSAPMRGGNVSNVSPPLTGGDEGEGDFFDHANDPLSKNDIKDLLELFKHGKNFGSLIQIPEKIAGKVKAIANLVESNINSSDIFTQRAANNLLPFVKEAMMLAGPYDCVVANPPYMGANYMNQTLREFGAQHFPDEKSDLFSIFVARILGLTIENGNVSLMTPFTWMNLTSYTHFRAKLLNKWSLTSLIKPEYHSFFDSAYVPICSFAIQKTRVHCRATFIDLSSFYGEDKQSPNAIIAIKDPICNFRHNRNTEDFLKVPSYVIAYSLSDKALNCFDSFEPLSNFADLRQGLITGENDRFLRYWHEVDLSKSSLTSTKDIAKWFPYQKGGAVRKWYGNNDYFVNWGNSGFEIRSFINEKGKLRSRPQNIQYYFREGLTWSSLTISSLSMRYVEEGFIFDAKGPMCFSKEPQYLLNILGYANSNTINVFLKELAPTMDYSQGPVGNVPFVPNADISNAKIRDMIAISKTDWDSFETSWNFQSLPLLITHAKATTIEQSWHNWNSHCISNIKQMQELETENNRIFIEAYGLQDELTPEVPEDQITLARADRESDIKRLITYAVGCMMGRYRIDRPGLIYAHSGNVDFWEIYNGDPVGANLCVRPALGQTHRSAPTFQPDDDGIIPVMDMDWFEDDAASRFEEFLKVAWPDNPSPQPSPNSRPDGAASRGEGALLEENMKFVADSLSPKAGETPRETIRRYFSTQFYKDHMQTYKKRPIYWLFSSGKQRAFECLVYLHRYNESTLSRMRNEYVTPLQGKFSARVEYLTNERDAATSTSARTKLQKQLDALKKKQVELAAFDDLLRHYADKRIPLDLDDGVKVNYGKFGNLLAEVKAVTGGIEE